MSGNQEYEFVRHLKGLSLCISFAEIDQRFQHWHGDVEILYIVRGTVLLSAGQDTYLLKRGDIVVVNHYEIHSLRQTGDDNLLCVVQFDPSFCKNYFSDLQYIRFSDRYLSSRRDVGRWGEVHEILVEMIKAYEENRPNVQFELVATLNRLVFTLLNRMPYHKFARKELDAYEINLERLNRILVYMHNNAGYRITLEELARREGLSTYHLSHFIRQYLGVSYQTYLGQVRLAKAVEMMATTDKSLSSIAAESGFSDVKYLKRQFLERYGCTPETFRQRNRKEDSPVAAFFQDQRSLANEKALLHDLVREISATGHVAELKEAP